MKFFPKANHTKKSGFTLTEVLVVVLVISVLAAMAYPIYTKSATKSRAVEAINLLEMVRNKQLIKFARDKEYYTEVSSLGQLTTNKSQESINGQELKVNNYTISLNSVKNCATAAYSKGNTNFSFSSGYDTAGLGCTGDICSSFGNIVGTAKDVCNCGSKSCSNGYTLNEDTCNCDCLLGCNQGGTCFVPYGGGSTRPCSSGCGTENSANSCNGAVWSGTCWSATQTQPTSQGCGNGGTQTRTCTPTCGGGSCGAWGTCTGQTCPAASKPTASEACGNCGTRTRTVTCNTNTGSWTTGSWGTCGGTGVCAVGATQSCGTGGTQTCTSSCAWGSCGGQDCPAASKPTASEACGNCNLGTRTRTVTCNTSTYTWTTGSWGTCTGGGACAAGATQTCNSTGTQTCTSSCTWGACSVQTCSESTKPTTSEACGNCNTGTRTRTVTCNTSNGTWTSGSWGTCTGGGACAAGATQTCNSTGTQTCSSSCTWGTCSVQSCSESTKPTTSEACGNCNTGTRTRTVTCNTSNGTWTSGSWGTCTGGGVCVAGTTQTCGNGGTQTCSSSCTWGTCACNSFKRTTTFVTRQNFASLSEAQAYIINNDTCDGGSTSYSGSCTAVSTCRDLVLSNSYSVTSASWYENSGTTGSFAGYGNGSSYLSQFLLNNSDSNTCTLYSSYKSNASIACGIKYNNASSAGQKSTTCWENCVMYSSSSYYYYQCNTNKLTCNITLNSAVLAYDSKCEENCN